ncbi:hypothetical protein HSIEG1_38 [Enterococcus sp. HSIEG1]|nr:hypothetical protein HSIEG1_38 [Enterococcus sp. HSIEG1]
MNKSSIQKISLVLQQAIAKHSYHLLLRATSLLVFYFQR